MVRFFSFSPVMRSLILSLLLSFVLSLGCAAGLWAQGDTLRHVHHQQVMFWNVENAFSPDDDPLTADDEFTPEGQRHWTPSRFRRKLLQLTRVILAAGQGRAPMLVGLAEVEGDSVMAYWTRHTPLWDQHYRYLVTHGPDARGIQTALLYDPTDFRLLGWCGHDVPMPQGTRPTRQILHAAGRLVSGDTLDVLVCHLPSRLGGARQSLPAREAAHDALMRLADSLQWSRQCPHILIMGDMNDAPSSRHLWWGRGFSNLMLPLQRALLRHPSRFGSHKYQGEWAFLDQFILNDQFLTPQGRPSGRPVGLRVSNARSFSLPFMLTDDVTHLGHRPLRSYYGYQYEGGYSDHLPIVLDLDIYF